MLSTIILLYTFYVFKQPQVDHVASYLCNTIKMDLELLHLNNPIIILCFRNQRVFINIKLFSVIQLTHGLS
jgi:hypothetical protein